MKKILILTAGFGDGHNAAARSLRDAIEFLDENSRAEVLDLFADSYGAFNTLARKTYLGMVQYAPSLWGGIYSMLENPFVEKQLGSFTRLQTMLEKILAETQPDCVVSTYPVYGHVIKKIYAGHERPFRSSPSSRIPSPSIPRGSARRAITSAWPTTPPPRF
jgi:processive 1,2-diacylglycerol beta-glucosyltransferase